MTGRGYGWRLLWGGSGPEGMDPRFVRRFVDLPAARGARRARRPDRERGDGRHHRLLPGVAAARGRPQLEVLDIRERAGADEPAMLAAERGHRVMLTGGDQLRLLDILGGTAFAAELLRRGRDGLLVAGSSAGSMALGDPVIVRGDPAEFHGAGAIRHERPASASWTAPPWTRTSWCAAASVASSPSSLSSRT